MPPRTRTASAGGGGDAGDADDEKHGTSRSRVQTYNKMIQTLNKKNYHEFMHELADLNYYAEWKDEVLDLKQEHPEYVGDGQEEADADLCRGRRDAYAVVRNKIAKELRHVLIGVKPGDIRALLKNINGRFCSLTAGAVQALTEEFNHMTMQTTGKTVEQFAYAVITNTF